MAPEAVTGTARDEPQCATAVDERRGDLVHRSVAADGHDELAAVIERASCELGRVARTLREMNRGVLLCGESADRRQSVGGAAGAGIDDEAGFQRAEDFDDGLYGCHGLNNTHRAEPSDSSCAHRTDGGRKNGVGPALGGAKWSGDRFMRLAVVLSRDGYRHGKTDG